MRTQTLVPMRGDEGIVVQVRVSGIGAVTNLMLSKLNRSISARAASTECAEKPRKHTLPSIFAFLSALMAPATAQGERNGANGQN